MASSDTERSNSATTTTTTTTVDSSSSGSTAATTPSRCSSSPASSPRRRNGMSIKRRPVPTRTATTAAAAAAEDATIRRQGIDLERHLSARSSAILRSNITRRINSDGTETLTAPNGRVIQDHEYIGWADGRVNEGATRPLDAIVPRAHSGDERKWVFAPEEFIGRVKEAWTTKVANFKETWTSDDGGRQNWESAIYH